MASCGDAPRFLPDPQLSEFVFNHAGRDTHEYVEVAGLPGTDYSAFTLVVVDGDELEAGTVEEVIRVGTADAEGLWTTTFMEGEVGNGSATLLLVTGFRGAEGFDLDTDDDGALDAQPFDRIADAVAVADGDGVDHTYADTILEPGLGDNPFPVGGASKLADGSWARNDFDGSGLDSFEGTLEPSEARNTLGGPNVILEPYRGFVLLGTIVTMASPEAVIQDGAVLVRNGTIEAVWAQKDGPPTDVDPAGLETIDTGGLVFPGLVDLHNHLRWNVLPRWDVSPTFENRYQWRDEASYGPEARWPTTILNEDRYAGLGDEVMKYAEVRALVGGTTSAQGSPQHREAYGSVLVRNLDHVNFGVDRVYSTVSDVRDIDDGHPLHDLLADDRLDAYFLHVAEGTDAASRDEFGAIREKGLLTDRLVLIHGIALEREDLRDIARVGAKLVWSPSSNLALYSETADIAAAVREGVLVSLAPDWSVTGGANLLAELKTADRWNRDHIDPPVSDFDLAQMVTVNPAKAIGWQGRVGTIKPGMQADLMVISASDVSPYRALIEATQKDVVLVTIGGDPLYGRAGWMERLKPGDHESVGCDDLERGLDVTHELFDKGDQTWDEIVAALQEAMRFAQWTDDPAFPGLHTLPLAPVLEACAE